MDADAVIAAGCVLATTGCLATTAPVALAGVAVVLVGCAMGWAMALREERSMRVPTSGCAGIGHRGERHTVAAQVTAREAGTP